MKINKTDIHHISQPLRKEKIIIKATILKDIIYQTDHLLICSPL